MQHLQSDKAKKDVMSVKKKLNHERGLKLDAFSRVDELQTQVRTEARRQTVYNFLL